LILSKTTVQFVSSLVGKWKVIMTAQIDTVLESGTFASNAVEKMGMLHCVSCTQTPRAANYQTGKALDTTRQ
jgi:hypothetical protein